MPRLDGLNKMLEGLNRFQQQVVGQSAKGKKQIAVNVGFAADYALHVHENLEAKHPNGQAKFLEQAARENKDELSEIIARSVKAKNGLTEGMVRAGKFLLGKAKELCPVVTGNLRDSGFVEIAS